MQKSVRCDCKVCQCSASPRRSSKRYMENWRENKCGKCKLGNAHVSVVSMIVCPLAGSVYGTLKSSDRGFCRRGVFRLNEPSAASVGRYKAKSNA